MKKILLFGKDGQVGRAITDIIGADMVVLGRAEVDLTAPPIIASALDAYQPSIIINAAAYTQVDKAESEQELAYAVNAHAPGVMAQWAEANDAVLVHYSTDYVFDGTGDLPWQEGDTTHPLSVYGKTKRDGELRIQAACARHLILRTSWVYDAHGKNFFNTMLRLGAERENLSVVADQYGAPTYAPHLVTATMEMIASINKKYNSDGYGTYHLCTSGETTWHGFAEAIFQAARAQNVPLAVKQVQPISTDDYPTPAKRPHNSRLDCAKVKDTFGIIMPAWQVGVEACIGDKYARR